MPWIQPITFEGKTVALRPARLGDAEALHAVCPPETFKYYVTLQPKDRSLVAFKEYLEARLNVPNMLSFVVINRRTDEIIGETSYMDIREESRGLEIGMTWYAEDYKGTKVNPECKYHLLAHAFETLGALRVTLKTDARNLHSQAAIMKLGASKEGTLRRHGIQPDGYVRDTVYFGITDLEWPTVKRRLVERLQKKS